jgi:hypothetical protein
MRMNGELIRIINYETARRPRRRVLLEAWTRARAQVARLVSRDWFSPNT